MYYGDDQAAYTNWRASFGPFGGALAAGAMGGAGYASPYGAQGYPEGGPQGELLNAGAQARPITYMPQAFAIPTQGGQFVMRGGLRRSFGYAMGWNEPPRNVSPYELQLGASGEFAERLGTGVAAAGLTGVGIAAGTAAMPVGAAAGGLVGAGVGGLIAGPLGALAGAKVGAVVGGFAAPILASSVTGGVSDLIAQQREVRNYLEAASFRFVGAGSEMGDARMGRGMGTRARREVAEMITQMDVKDRFLDSEELGRIMKAGAEQGVFTGTQNLTDFKKRFKDLTDNVKEIAKAFNTSLEDAVKVVRDMRSMGMDPSQARQMVSTAESLGRVAGRTAAEMFAVGQQGAEMYRGTGVSMQVGFQAAQANLTSIRAARDAGILSQEAIAQAGGEEALAQRVTAGSLGFAQSQYGRGMLMSMVRGGQLDAEGLQDLAGGKTLVQTAMSAAANISNPTALMQFQARQPHLVSELGKQFGGQGLEMLRNMAIMQRAQYMQTVMPGLSTEDAFRATAQRSFNMSESEIDTSLSMMRNASKAFEAGREANMATYRRQRTDAAYNNFMFTRAGAAVKDVWTSAKNIIAEPVNKTIDNFSDKAKDFFTEHIYGVKTIDMRGIDTPSALVGNVLEQKADFEKVKEKLGPRNLDVGGLFVRTRGEQILSMIGEGKFLTKAFGIEATTDKSQMVTVLDTSRGAAVAQGAAIGFGLGAVAGPGAILGTAGGALAGYAGSFVAGGTEVGFSKPQQDATLAAINVARNFTMSDEDAAAMKKTKKYQETYARIRKAASEADFRKFSDVSDMAKAFLGTSNFFRTSPEEALALTEVAQKTGNEDLLKDVKKLAGVGAGLAGDIAALDIEAAKKDYLALEDVVGEYVRPKDKKAIAAGGLISNMLAEQRRKPLNDEQKAQWTKTMSTVLAATDKEREEAIEEGTLALAKITPQMSVPQIKAKLEAGAKDEVLKKRFQESAGARAYAMKMERASYIQEELTVLGNKYTVSEDARKRVTSLAKGLDADTMGEKLASASEDDIKALKEAKAYDVAHLTGKLTEVKRYVKEHRDSFNEQAFEGTLQGFNVDAASKKTLVEEAKKGQWESVTNKLTSYGLTGESLKEATFGGGDMGGTQGTPGAMSQEVMMTQNAILSEVKNVLLLMEKRLGAPK